MMDSQIQNRIENRQGRPEGRFIRAQRSGAHGPKQAASFGVAGSEESDWMVYKRKYRAHGALSQRHTLRVLQPQQSTHGRISFRLRRIPVDGRRPPFPNEITSAVAYRSCLSEGCKVIGYGRTGPRLRRPALPSGTYG